VSSLSSIHTIHTLIPAYPQTLPSLASYSLQFGCGEALQLSISLSLSLSVCLSQMLECQNLLLTQFMLFQVSAAQFICSVPIFFFLPFFLSFFFATKTGRLDYIW